VKVKKRMLKSLGHVARMPDLMLTKSMAGSPSPAPGVVLTPRTRKRDMIRKDLKDVGVVESEWSEEAAGPPGLGGG